MPYKKMYRKKRYHKGLKNKVRKLEKKVSLIDTSIERKNIDLESDQLFASTGVPVFIIHNAVDLANIGADVDERIGNKITGRQVQFRCILRNSPVSANVVCIRVLVVRWINNQRIPVAADSSNVLDYPDLNPWGTPPNNTLEAINAPYLINSLKKYRVLDDKVFYPKTTENFNFYNRRFTLKGKAQEMTFENITPTRDDPSNNQISLFAFCSYQGAAPAAGSEATIAIRSRLYYNDM